MKFWKIKSKQAYKLQETIVLSKTISFKKILILQIFNDLCISRKWKKLKIIKTVSEHEFLIVGVIPFVENLQNSLEIFLPLDLTVSVLRIKQLFNFQSLEIIKRFFADNYVINLAIMDLDSTIAYYKISIGVKKTTGPFL